MEPVIMIWLLLSLITLLGIIQYSRHVECNSMELWGLANWVFAIVTTIFPPVGLLFLFVMYVWPELIKERKLW